MTLHEWIDLALFVGGIAATLGNLFLLRFFGGLDALREKVALHAIEIRDNRTAIAEARIKTGLGSFPYTT
jgi:hypothetical protein